VTFRWRSRAAGTEAVPVGEFRHLRQALDLQLDAVRALAGANDAAARVAYERARVIELELTAGEQEA
jgi:hypothetical protein